MKPTNFAWFLALGSLSASAAITADFNVDLSPGAQNYADAGAVSLVLNYTIDGAGNVSLDAVALTGVGGDASPARFNQIDNGSAGTTASAALYNTAFALTYSGSGDPRLSYPSYGNAGTGAVLGDPTGFAHVLDQTNTGTGPRQFIGFTVSGTATAVSGFSLDLTSMSYDLRIANGGSSFGVEDTSGTVVEQNIPNTSLDGTILTPGISLAAGETMTFRPKLNQVGGAGLSGFTFEVSAIPEPSVALLGGLGLLALLRRRRA